MVATTNGENFALLADNCLEEDMGGVSEAIEMDGVNKNGE